MPLLEPAPAGEEPEAPETEEVETPEASAEEPKTRVELKPKGRRAQAIEELNGKFKTFEERFTKYDEERNQRDQEIARIRGELEATRRQPVYVQPQAPAPQLPDPEVLERQALEALDKRDMTTYQRLSRQAAKAEMLREVAPLLQQRQQAPQSDAPPPALMAKIYAHPDIAALPNHTELLAAKNAELDARYRAGIPGATPPGPQRIEQVFAETDAMVKSWKKPNGAKGPQFSQQSAAALSGVPTARGGAPGGNEGAAPGVELSAEEKKWAKKAKMSLEEYAGMVAQQHPERVRR